MVAVKGQPNLVEAFETYIKAAEKRRKRSAHYGGSSAAGHLPHQVFGGPSGTGKTSSVKVLAKVLASPEVNLLKKQIVVTLNKDTILSNEKGTQPQVVRRYFEKAEGGILFLDEVHRRTKEFAQALLTPLEDFQGKVMVIIAGYDEQVRKWLRDGDPGLPSRFPGRVEFKKLSIDTLVEIGEHRMVDPLEYPIPFSLDPSARDTFRRVMELVSARTEPCDLPLNARGARIAVDAMINRHEARDGLDYTDVCITAKDILEACPFTASHPPAAAASSHAPTAAGEGRGGSTSSLPAPAAALVSSKAAASSGASRAPAAAAAEAVAGAPSASSRKRKAESEEVGARDLSPEAKAMVKVIDALYKLDEEASPIVAWDLLKKLHELRQFENGSSVHEKMEQSKALGKKLKDWLKEGIGHISARGGKSKNVRHEVTSRDNKLMVYGLSPKN